MSLINNDNVKLYLPMNGKDSSTTTKDYAYNNHIVTFGGSTAIKKTTYYERVSSCYFPGSNSDIITMPNHTDFDLGSTFMLMAKCYNSNLSSTQYLCGRTQLASPYAGWYVKVETTGRITVSAQNNANTLQTPTGVVKANRWYDLRIYNNSGLLKIYVDGILQGTTTSATFQNYSSAFVIGDRCSLAGTPWNGYVDEFLIVKDEVWDDYDFRYSDEKSTSHSLNSKNLVKAWKLWETSGKIYDTVGNEVGTPTGTTTYGSNNPQGYNCIETSGANNTYFTVSYSKTASQALSVSWWMNLDTDTGNATGVWEFGNFTCQINWNTGNNLLFAVNDSTLYSTYISATSLIGSWKHITFTWNPSTHTIKIYVNGVDQNVTTGTSGTFSFGAKRINSTTDYSYSIDGKMSDLYIFEEVLTLSDTQKLYNNGRGKLLRLSTNHRLHKQLFFDDYLDSYRKNLTASWNLNEITGTRHDSANQLHLTDHNTVGSSVDTKYGRVATFNGTNQFLSVSDNDLLDLSGAFSVRVLFKLSSTHNSSSSEMALFGKTDDMVTSGGGGYTLFLTTSGTLKFLGFHASSQFVQIESSKTSWAADTWFDVVVTWDGTTNSNGLKIYLNTVLEKQSTSSYSSIATNTKDFKIGVIGAYASYYTGTIGVITIWSDIVLDSTAVSSLYSTKEATKYNWQMNRPLPGSHLIDCFGLRETGGERWGLKKALVADNTNVFYDTGIKGAFCAKTLSTGHYLSIATTEYDFSELFATMCWTIGFWFNGSQTTTQSDLLGVVDGSNNGLRIERNNTANGDLRVLFNETQQILTSGIFNDSDWHRIVLTCSNHDLRLYCDGVLTGQKGSPTIIGDAGLALYLLGYNNNGSLSGTCANVKLQEVVFLDTPVDENFIKADWEQGVGWLYEYDTTYFNNLILDAQGDCLKAGWKLGDTSDSIGSHTLTEVGNPSHPVGIDGGGLGLDGVDDTVYANDSNDWYLGQDNFAISMWFKLDTFKSNQYLFFQTLSTNSDDNLIRLYFGTPSWMYLASRTSGSYDFEIQVSWTPTTDTWYHMLWIRNGTSSSDWKLYINGVSQSLTFSAGSASGSVQNLTGPLYLGSHNGIDAFLHGVMDEFYWWKRTSFTNSSAIDSFASALYRDGVGRHLTEVGLKKRKMYGVWKYDTDSINNHLSSTIAHWKFGDYETWDTMGIHPLTNHNSVSFANLGKDGKCANFNVGSNNAYLTCSRGNDDFLMTKYSISMWVLIETSLTGGADNVYFPLRLRTASKSIISVQYWSSDYHNKVWFGFYHRQFNDTEVGVAHVGAISANVWHHIVCVLGDGSYLKIYIDNSLTTGTAAYNGTVADVSGTTLYLGYDHSDLGSNTHCWDGKMDEIEILEDVALTATEVSARYDNGSGRYINVDKNDNDTYLTGLNKYLVAAWNLDEKSGKRHDAVNHNHLMDNHTVGYVDDTDFGVVADFNRGDTEFLTMTPFYTKNSYDIISVWVKFDSLSHSSQRFFSWYDTTPAGYYNIMLQTTSSNNKIISYSYFSKYSLIITGTTTINSDTWYNVVYILDYDGSTALAYLYVNGIYQGTQSQSGSSQTATQVVLGAGSFTGSDPIDGKMSRCYWWKSNSQILADADSRLFFAAKMYGGGKGVKVGGSW